jgi:protein-L-isoaspartate(D-aspartate) O-methyltransferase
MKNLLIDFWRSSFEFTKEEIKAFNSVNREDFLPEELIDMAYHDIPLPIMRGKTISQPTTVMIMTAALELSKNDKVFEVGTGSGYQAAIISRVAENVITTEIIPELVQFARANLKKSGINNVHVYEEDGAKGFEKEAPYDKIIITAACKDFPKQLIEQLKIGGIIVAPVGDKFQQEMVRGVKTDKRLELDFLGSFRFTPLYGEYGFEI